MRSNTGQILYIPRVGQRANLQHPLMKGCVGWWPLTDGGGGIAKDLVGSNNGTLDATVSFGNGQLGNNAEFNPDGVNDGITTTYSPNGLSAFSVSAWLRNDGDSLGTTYGKIASSDHGLGIDFMIHKGNGTPRIYAQTGLSISSTSPPTGEWWHAVATWVSGSSPKMYINGVEVSYSSQTSYTGTLSTSTIELGDTATQNRPLEGGLQNVRIWNRALSDSEILELYTNPWSGLSIPSATRYFFVSQPQQIFPPRMKLKTSINLGKGGRIVI